MKSDWDEMSNQTQADLIAFEEVLSYEELEILEAQLKARTI